MFTSARPSHAQSRSPGSDEVVAQKEFEEALAAFSAKDYETARRLFLKVYRLRPTANVAQNLGRAELLTGNYVEAARHLLACLRADDAREPARKLAHEALREAESHIGKLKIDVNVDDANVLVDGESYGTSPVLGQTVYVEPGKHTIAARKNGYADATKAVDVGPGQLATVVLVLRPSTERPTGDTPSTTPPINPDATKVVVEPVDPHRSSSLPGASTSSTRTWIVAGLGAAAVVATATAVGFGIAANNDRSQLEQYQRTMPVPCPSTHDACSNWKQTWESETTHARWANALYIAGGALAAGSVLSFLLWPRPSTPAPPFTATIGPRAASLSFRAEF